MAMINSGRPAWVVYNIEQAPITQRAFCSVIMSPEEEPPITQDRSEEQNRLVCNNEFSDYSRGSRRGMLETVGERGAGTSPQVILKLQYVATSQGP